MRAAALLVLVLAAFGVAVAEPLNTGPGAPVRQRLPAAPWSPLAARQAAALHAAIAAIPAASRRPVVVWCDERAGCGAIAEQFHAAFSAASWPSQRSDSPRLHVGAGLHISDARVAAAVTSVIGSGVETDAADPHNILVTFGSNLAR